MKRIFLILFSMFVLIKAEGQVITFCAEQMPMNNLVLNKFMEISAKWNSSKGARMELQSRALMYFPIIEKLLQQFELPPDFKYLPLVESGLRNLTSVKQAKGIWQLMPGTAVDMGMVVNAAKDERTQFVKSTLAACKLLKQLYKGTHSWTLTAAAYNTGLNNIRKEVKKQQQANYYQLSLNAETSEYVYRIIILKLLLEDKLHYSDAFDLKNEDYTVFAIDTARNDLWSKPDLNCYLQIF